MGDAAQLFTVLYEQHHDSVERYVRRRVVDSIVPDVVADVFLVVWRRLGDVPSTAELPWIYGIARRVLANEFRSQHRAGALAERVATHLVERSDDHADHVLGRLEIARAFDRLAPADQETLRLVAWEALEPRAAAIAAGCSVPTFLMRLHRARRRLRRTLDAMSGADHEPNHTGDSRTVEPAGPQR